jgi:AsmA protein
MKKVLLIIIVLVALVIISLTVLIKIYVTPESVKAYLIPYAETALNRKVYFDKVRISLLKGIEVSDFVIKDKDGESDFITCKEFILKYKLLPLLSKQLIIEELKLVSPQVNIKRDTQGVFNFEGIGQEQKRLKVKEKREVSKPGVLPISLLIDSIVVEHALFSLVDLKKELPDIRGSIDITMGIESAGESELFSQGSMDLKFHEIKIKGPPEKHIKDFSSRIKYTVTTDIKSKAVRIENADVNIQGIPVALSGKITKLDTSPEIDLAVTIPQVNTSEIKNIIDLFSELKGLALSGSLIADLHVQGLPQQPDSLKTKGTVTLKNTSIEYESTKTILDGSLNFSGQTVQLDVKSTLGKDTAQIKGSVSSLFKNQHINLNMYSNRLVLDELIPVRTKQTEKKPLQKSTSVSGKPVSEAKPLDLKMTAGGEIKIKSALYRDMVINDFHAIYTFKNNILNITELSGVTGKGKFSIMSTIDFSKPGYVYSLDSDLDSLHGEEVVNMFFPKAKDTIFGILSFDLNLNGAGTTPEHIRKSLQGKGSFNILDGKITDTRLSERLSLFMNIDELKTIILKKAQGTVNIKNGIVQLDSIFASDDIVLDPSGTIGLNETLNLAFDLKLSPRLTDMALKNPGIASYIKDEEGWGKIPLQVSGTFAKPSYSVDVAKAGKRVIEKKAQEFLKDLFKKEGEEGEGEKLEEKKPVQDLFKELFK